MFGFKWRSLLMAGVVAFAGSTMGSSSADGGWGYRYGYRPMVAPVRVYRPAYRYRARYVAPVRRFYRPVVPVPVAPIPVTPYSAGYRAYPTHSAGYRAYPNFGGYRARYGGYGVSVNFGVAPVGYIGY